MSFFLYFSLYFSYFLNSTFVYKLLIVIFYQLGALETCKTNNISLWLNMLDFILVISSLLIFGQSIKIFLAQIEMPQIVIIVV